MPVCVVSISNRKVIKTRQEEWRDPDDNCIICKCGADKNSTTDFYPISCRNTSDICLPCGEVNKYVFFLSNFFVVMLF